MSVSTELATTKRGKAELAEQLSFTAEQTRLMKDTVAKGATDNEFMLFMHLAQHYGLDPFLKEIWCLKYASNQPATVFTSRDGYLKIASRDPQMDGIQSDVVREGDVLEKRPDGTVHQTYGNPRGAILGAFALVWRKDRTHPAYFYAPLNEYNTGNNPTWKKYPSAMIVKVAEAMALKRAFSISGLVTQEELGLEVEPAEELATGAVVLSEPTPATTAKQPAGNAPAATASTSPAASTTSGLSEEDERKLAGHRTQFFHARTMQEVHDIWNSLSGRFKELLTKEKDEAKVRMNKRNQQPVADDLVGPFVEKPTTGAADATDEQRTLLVQLSRHEVLTAKEKADVLGIVRKLDQPQAGQLIFRLRNVIPEREGRNPDKEIRQALHQFLYRKGERLGAAEVARLGALVENDGVHWQVLYDEMAAASASLVSLAVAA